VSGSSRLGRSGTASALSAQGSGASNLELADLHLQNLDIQLSGASHGSVKVTGTIAGRLQADLHGHTPVRQAGHLGWLQHPNRCTKPQASPACGGSRLPQACIDREASLVSLDRCSAVVRWRMCR
jgi:hypothetical protein